MDVGLTRFETETKLITLMDAPGHKDFIPNMITGAAQVCCSLTVLPQSMKKFHYFVSYYNIEWGLCSDWPESQVLHQT